MSSLEAVANAAKNFALTYDMAVMGYVPKDAVAVDLEVLEEAIREYRAAGSVRHP